MTLHVSFAHQHFANGNGQIFEICMTTTNISLNKDFVVICQVSITWFTFGNFVNHFPWFRLLLVKIIFVIIQGMTLLLRMDLLLAYYSAVGILKHNQVQWLIIAAYLNCWSLSNWFSSQESKEDE